nr:proSAAS [Vicugna pacos]
MKHGNKPHTYKVNSRCKDPEVANVFDSDIEQKGGECRCRALVHRPSVTVYPINKVIHLLPEEGEVGTRPAFHSTESIFFSCLLWRQQGLLPWQLPSDCHGNRHRRLQLSTLPLGHLHGDGRDGGAAGVPRLRLRRVEGGGEQGSLSCAAAEHLSSALSPRRCAFASQSARPEPGSLGQHGGVRAGGAGLLVLLLLGWLGPPPALCARPVKEPRSLGAASPPLAEAGAPRHVDPELLRYLLGRILAGSADSEAVAAPRRLRRAADQDLGPEVPPEGVLGALLRVKRLETPAPQAPARRLLP